MTIFAVALVIGLLCVILSGLLSTGPAPTTSGDEQLQRTLRDADQKVEDEFRLARRAMNEAVMAQPRRLVPDGSRPGVASPGRVAEPILHHDHGRTQSVSNSSKTTPDGAWPIGQSHAQACERETGNGDARQDAYVLSSEVDDARARLSAWVIERAEATAKRVGFRWAPSAHAPSTYADLCMAVFASSVVGQPLAVSSQHSDAVILISPETNYAWRFVHDVGHVERKLTFSLPDEFELALWHLDELERDGFSPSSLEYAFLKADTLGQVIVNALTRRFPEDQARFALDCQQFGFEQGILREIGRESS